MVQEVIEYTRDPVLPRQPGGTLTTATPKLPVLKYLFKESEPEAQPVRYHWECGRHSGIPPCCRVFYIAVWSRCHRRPLRELYLSLVGPWEYVPCPVCMVRGRGKDTVLRDCTCDGFKNGTVV